MYRLVAPLILAAMLAAPAVAAPRLQGEAKLAKMIEGRSAGAPVSCLPVARSTSSTKIEGVGMVYQRGRTLFVNRFQDGCPSLTAFRGIVTRTPSTQICRGDIARVVDFVNGIEGGSCVLGEFVPYEKAR